MIRSGDSDLRSYVLARQDVTELVRRGLQYLESGGAPGRAERCRDLLARLAEDRFNLAVVGQFKRGKSTLMNAIIGRDVLPTGVLPLTSAITTLRYGPRERVRLQRRGWTLEQEIPLSQLADFVTEEGNPGNERGLVEARVELPVPFLRRGLHFIDTPGVGSSHEENTATTQAFLPSADAVIFVTGVDAPLGDAESRFLLEIREHVRQLLVVVNKIDTVPDEDRDRVVDFVRARLSETLGLDGLRVHAASATLALSARLRADAAALERSGVLALEAAIADFLANEQGRSFLVSILDHLLVLLEPDGQARAEESGRAADLPEDGRGGDLREAVRSARARLLDGSPLASEPSASTDGTVPGPQADGSERLRRAIATSAGPAPAPRVPRTTASCPVCLAQGDALFRFFATWQHALATDGAAREAFLATGGFCPAHAWQFQQLASPQTIGVAYVPLVEAAAARLRAVPPQASPGPTAGTSAQASDVVARSADASCPACEVARQAQAAAAARLLQDLGTEEGRTRYGRTDGLCLRHFEQVLADAADGDVRTWLVSDQVRRLEELAEDVHAATLKREATRRALLNEDEARAWRRALVAIVGERVASGAPPPAEDRV